MWCRGCIVTRDNTPGFYCGDVGRHHSSLCPKQFGDQKKAGDGGSDSRSGNDGNGSSGTANLADSTSMLANDEATVFQTLKAVVKTPTTQSEETLVLDCCSNRSYITDSLAKKLRLKLQEGPTLSVTRFGAKKPVQVRTKMAELTLLFHDESELRVTVTVLPEISGDIQRCVVSSAKLRNLAKTLKLADDVIGSTKDIAVDFLLGNDYYADVLTGGKIEVQEGLYLLGSRAGWILSGRIKSPNETVALSFATNSSSPLAHVRQTSLHCQAVSQTSDADLGDLFSLESLGITDKPNKIEDEDLEAMENFEDTVHFDGERYHVTLPWKSSRKELKDNYYLALNRLRSVVNRFGKNGDLQREYAKTIKSQLETGIIEVVDDQITPVHPIHYIPHHAVVQPHRVTTKVRIVYDGSAKSQKYGVSLNESLLRGPVLLQDLAGLLLRFRLNNIGIVADIEKAFLQVGVQMPDRDVTRFLWLKDPTKAEVDDNLQTYRFCRVPFGLNCSPFLLEATVDYHLKLQKGETAANIRENKYVDNVITGAKTSSEAITLYKEGKEIFQKAGMNLRQWATNDEQLRQHIPPDDKSKADVLKVLGMKWDTGSDLFLFTKVPEPEVTTKRQLVSAVALVFDPLGLLLPLTVSGKMILQATHLLKKEWDAKLPVDLIEKWKETQEQRRNIEKIKIPRQIVHTEDKFPKMDLLCFCDASADCFATTVFVRSEDQGRVAVHLSYAKSRLRPLKDCSIPRMELLGLLIGVRATSFVKKQRKRPVNSCYMWTDSMVVLGWVASEKSQGTFVDNRIREIRQKGQEFAFLHVKGEENPADLATRANSMVTLPKLWLNGPEWTKKNERHWSGWEKRQIIEKQEKEPSLPAHAKTRSSKTPLDIQPEKFSSLSRLLRVTAWALRFINILRKKSGKNVSVLQPDEIKEAKTLWERSAQAMYLHNEIKGVEKELKVYKDEQGILRCRGRFAHAPLSYDEKHPKLLPTKSHFTQLVAWQKHHVTLHGVTTHTLAEIRKEYWIPSGRRFLRHILRKCTTCRKLEGKSYGARPIPDLPPERVTPAPAFTYTGVDYFGPLLVKDGDNTKKVWVCLFTCLVVRAVHLEMVHDMTTAEFILALRRFIARYHKPKTIISDHGSQFGVASEALQILWRSVEKDDTVLNYCAENGINFKKITPNAPWEGGAYERMVQIVKRPLRKVLGKLLLSPQQLETILLEVSAVVNSRPLTYISDDREPGWQILKPSNFLSPGDKAGMPSGDDKDFQSIDAVKKVVQLYKADKNRLDHFWKIWKDEYLLSLRDRPKKNKKNDVQDPKQGDVVIVEQNDLRRGNWKVAKIVKLIPGRDGETRSAEVLLPNKQVIRRSILQLYPLELRPDKDSKSGSVAGDNTPAI